MTKKVADSVDQTDVKPDKSAPKTENTMRLWDAMFHPEKYKEDRKEDTKQKRIASKVKKTI